MIKVGEILGFGMQGRVERGGGGGGANSTTLVEFLRERMEGSDPLIRRKTFKVRLGFVGCCGATWGSASSDMTVRDDGANEDEEVPDSGSGELGIEVLNVGQTARENGSAPAACDGDMPASSGMNLAAALAAERNYRAAQEPDGMVGLSRSPRRPNDHVPAGTPAAPGTPFRMSLMRLLEETDGFDDGEMGKEGVGSDSMCCVCMGRKKGAALIPCGHTFCRVCTRELWLNRGFCPLCNRSILEVLDIF